MAKRVMKSWWRHLYFWLTHAGQWATPEWNLDPEPNMGPPWPDSEYKTEPKPAFETGETMTEGTAAEMPRYKCHKEVWALKIAKIKYHGNAKSEGAGGLGATITPDDSRYAVFEVDNSYVMKHSPKVGGYYVVYDDGYKSFSPAKAFEDGYSRV